MDRTGLIYLLCASACFSVMSLFVKLAGLTLSSDVLVMVRAVITLMLGYGALKARGISTRGVNRKMLLTRGLFGFCGLYSYYFGVTHLPLAEVTVLHSLNPVFTVLLATLFLKESSGAATWLGIALSLVGTVLIARPALFFQQSMPGDAAGVTFAILSAVFSALAYVSVRKLTQTDDPLVIVFYFSLVAAPASIPFALRAWQWPSGIEWLYLLLIGISTQMAQVLMTHGMKRIPAGQATTIGYSQVLFATLWGMLIFSEEPHLLTVVGMLLIFVSTVMVAAVKTHSIER